MLQLQYKIIISPQFNFGETEKKENLRISIIKKKKGALKLPAKNWNRYFFKRNYILAGVHDPSFDVTVKC
jgi:hypothetical protein